MYFFSIILIHLVERTHIIILRRNEWNQSDEILNKNNVNVKTLEYMSENFKVYEL